jgi:DNA-binding Xre family transcriptional regulator
MISYRPLLEQMKNNKVTTYTLRKKGGISSSSVRRIKSGESISTNTIDALCVLLDCTVADIIEYIPEE